MESGTRAPDAERRVYHAQLITCLAVLPTVMGLAMLGTAATMGDHDLRGELLAHPLAWVVALATAALYMLAWWLLGRRRRAGATLAGVLFLWMILAGVASAHRSLWTIAYAIAGLVIVARAWPAMRGASYPAP